MFENIDSEILNIILKEVFKDNFSIYRFPICGYTIKKEPGDLVMYHIHGDEGGAIKKHVLMDIIYSHFREAEI